MLKEIVKFRSFRVYMAFLNKNKMGEVIGIHVRASWSRYVAMLAVPGRVGNWPIAFVAAGCLLHLAVDANQRAAEERGGVDAA